MLKDKLKEEKFPDRESFTKALGRYMIYQIQSDTSSSSLHAQTVSSIVSALQDESSEVRRRALSALKAATKANPTAIMAHVSIFGHVLAERLKDGSTPVKLAAERKLANLFFGFARRIRGNRYLAPISNTDHIIDPITVTEQVNNGNRLLCD
ncbi:protein ILITYHIA isoform X1 [Spinacia oleracea]|uniref:Protein ILITYHIA isoform X1 n=1 Tax=Spinacia oleracea TaxID=3562 RepID=A0ABM3R5R5_SPIOL|nr:protein ILITYHIA-like isoform X1 [Spinacia oleracea]XP_056690958.1 protein ILITYHIA-like isoform X1 [Spinacia oleracea]XP_056690959.1 protein ILITYHIA-like isoform X1 [Spinacia oleracea]XP_056690960.1 protein ILITYHIA-like isoform X1 [Spinacia oleracea]XP_056690961.1 protein ILITYHIA-like isoform X1 [Spinacia oleracea]XP_056690962.1 protein ILITYHIA-like isoform X1 [Spinacia oleracea]XP_056690963.1 protein ILITYHIA-like isoform X1 [Spinacia oleracea]XP_056690964.1 protein ILITYHIA-like is